MYSGRYRLSGTQGTKILLRETVIWIYSTNALPFEGGKSSWSRRAPSNASKRNDEF